MFLGNVSEREAARNGDKTAVVEAVSGRRLTYRELHDRVSRLAQQLASRAGVRRGDRVAVLALNTAEYLEVYLAAARAGLVTQGLNWRLAPAELERVLRDGAPKVVIAQDEFQDVAVELQRRVDVPHWLSFGHGSDGSYEDLLAACPGPGAPGPELSADDPVLIIYTGGTSGEPKGAVHTNRSCMAALVNSTVAERAVPQDRYLLLGQMFHSASLLALNYLVHGATAVLVPKFEPRLALEVVEAERVTASLAFPVMITYMLEEAGGNAFDLSSLRNLQYGGGPIAPATILAMIDALPCSLIQCYGTSEHLGVTWLSQEDHIAARAGENVHLLRSCGKEAHWTRVHLLDERGVPVPRDGKTPGEIVVSSPANMRGYWNRPDLTEEAGRGRYGLATGDLAVWDEDGYVYVVDRLKDMIVSGAENIYPAQVEKAISQHPSVLEVAVVGRRDELWGESVVAFVVLKKGTDATADEIRDTVGRELGSYQKPREVTFLPELPKSSTGKIAKHELVPLATASGV
jgi:acyl-CoA synthetase (AMP-forming)/AMP-acid ligase II